MDSPARMTADGVEYPGDFRGLGKHGPAHPLGRFFHGETGKLFAGNHQVRHLQVQSPGPLVGHFRPDHLGPVPDQPLGLGHHRNDVAFLQDRIGIEIDDLVSPQQLQHRDLVFLGKFEKRQSEAGRVLHPVGADIHLEGRQLISALRPRKRQPVFSPAVAFLGLPGRRHNVHRKEARQVADEQDDPDQGKEINDGVPGGYIAHDNVGRDPGRRLVTAALHRPGSGADNGRVGHAAGDDPGGKSGCQPQGLAQDEHGGKIEADHEQGDGHEFKAVEAQTGKELRAHLEAHGEHEEVEEDSGQEGRYVVFDPVAQVGGQADQDAHQQGAGRGAQFDEAQRLAPQPGPQGQDQEKQHEGLGAEKIQQPPEQTQFPANSRVNLTGLGSGSVQQQQ